MGHVTVPQMVDGITHTAAQHNNQANAIANEFNGNIDDTNIKTGAGISTAKLAEDNSITAAMISSSAITLGYAQITTGISGVTAEADITGLTKTVIVPAGGRNVRITIGLPEVTTDTNGQRVALQIKEGSTQLARMYKWLPSTAGGNGVTFSTVLVAPTAGSHTYKATITRDVGAGTIGAYAAAVPDHAFILVEAL